jgi:DNA segregation ATPase FtsK/SpoIIIE-like protein
MSWRSLSWAANRAARIIEEMENQGMVDKREVPAAGKRRDVGGQHEFLT